MSNWDGMEEPQCYFPLSSTMGEQSFMDEFSTLDTFLNNGMDGANEEVVMTTCDEPSYSGHSSDSGNYSPTTSTFAESSSSPSDGLDHSVVSAISESPWASPTVPFENLFDNDNCQPTTTSNEMVVIPSYNQQQQSEKQFHHHMFPNIRPFESHTQFEGAALQNGNTLFTGSKQPHQEQQQPLLRPAAISSSKFVSNSPSNMAGLSSQKLPVLSATLTPVPPPTPTQAANVYVLVQKPAVQQQQIQVVGQPASKFMSVPTNSLLANKVLYSPPTSQQIAGPFQSPLVSCPAARQQQQADQAYVLKKEDRRLRNRESAQISRQRKKEELNNMRTELEQSHKRCEKLECENRELRQRVHQLEQQLLSHHHHQKTEHFIDDGTRFSSAKANDTAKANGGRPTAKTTAGVCMLVLLSWMVIFPPDSMPNRSEIGRREQLQLPAAITEMDNQKQMDRPTHPHGRALADFTGANGGGIGLFGTDNNSSTITLGLTANGTATTLHQNSSLINSCGGTRMHNKSLSIKLTEDLYTWIDRHEKMELVQLRRGGQLPPFSAIATGHVPPLLPKLRINSSEFDADENNDEKAAQRVRKERARKRNSQKVHTARNASKNATTDTIPESASSSATSRSIRRDLRRFFSLANKNNQRRAASAAAAADQKQEKLLAQMDVQQMLKLVQGIRRGDPKRKDHQQQEDNNTLYIIPLHDYFLLAPNIGQENMTANGMPPKLSIILPALSPPMNTSNSTFSLLSMMRIECEVVDTNVFFLPEGLVKSLSNVQQQQQ